VRRLASLLALAWCALAPALGAQGNSELERSRARLDSIRVERLRLQDEQRRLAGRVSDANAQLRNYERQRANAGELVTEIERQIGGLGSRLDRSAAELALAQDNLLERRAVLQRRLVDIYKRGPLHTFQVLLAAESFGDLLTRYKYLYLTSRQDRTLVTEVERLTDRVRSQRNELLGIQSELDRRRQEREAEIQRYGDLVQREQSTLRTLQRSSDRTREQLTTLQRDEARLTNILANLESARRNAGGAPPRAGGGLNTADIGKLDWPVEGEILYQFGRERLPNGGVILRNGIAIGAAPGSSVTAVDSGTVRLKERLSTYGLTLIVEHTSGLYAIYAQLSTTSVERGERIAKGQSIGTVGGLGSDQGPHLYFEIRGENQIALDPMVWLRSRR
jgi:septal ring factor EnvC (AmiA/AmiB activator)